jgi:Terminase small subunit
LAARRARRTRSRTVSGDALSHLGPPEAGADAPVKAETEFEDVEVRAARLGVTVEKVLREYAAIAFADLRRIVSWDQGKLHVKEHLSKNAAASISEISAGTAGNGPVRVKLYDKKAALDAIARHLGMFAPNQKRHEDDDWIAAAEEAREELARWLARLAAEPDEGQAS